MHKMSHRYHWSQPLCSWVEFITERLMRNRIHHPVLGSSAPGAAPAPETLRGPSLVVVETVAKLPGNQNIRPVRRHP